MQTTVLIDGQTLDPRDTPALFCVRLHLGLAIAQAPRQDPISAGGSNFDPQRDAVLTRVPDEGRPYQPSREYAILRYLHYHSAPVSFIIVFQGLHDSCALAGIRRLMEGGKGFRQSQVSKEGSKLPNLFEPAKRSVCGTTGLALHRHQLQAHDSYTLTRHGHNFDPRSWVVTRHFTIDEAAKQQLPDGTSNLQRTLQAGFPRVRSGISSRYAVILPQSYDFVLCCTQQHAEDAYTAVI